MQLILYQLFFPEKFLPSHRISNLIKRIFEITDKILQSYFELIQSQDLNKNHLIYFLN